MGLFVVCQRSQSTYCSPDDSRTGVDKGGGVLNYSSKPRTTFWKLDVTTIVIGAIIGVTILTCTRCYNKY